MAHPNVQQLLASIWYEGLPGFRRKNMALQALEIVRIGRHLINFNFLFSPIFPWHICRYAFPAVFYHIHSSAPIAIWSDDEKTVYKIYLS